MRKTEIWEFIHLQLQRNIPTALIIVTNTDGFTPGKTGFKLALTSNGSTCGTIGGGNIEFEMIEKGKNFLQKNQKQPVELTYSLNSEINEKNGGMICGGEQKLTFIFFTSFHISEIEKLISCILSHQKGEIFFNQFGNIKVVGFDKLIQDTKDSEHKIYAEHFGYEPIIHIIGGGHVSLALSRILSTLNYFIIVYDERNIIEQLDNNIFADEKKNILFSNVHSMIEESEQTYIVIMTPGHLSDEIVLRNTIKMNVGYIGMMASPTKRAEIFNKLRNDGYEEKTLNKLHCPIGIPINSQTPEEIAISIAAEIIKINSLKFNLIR